VLSLVDFYDYKVCAGVIYKVRPLKVTGRVYYLIVGVEAKVVFKVVLGKGGFNLEFFGLDILGATELTKVIYKRHSKVAFGALTFYKVLICEELMKAAALRLC
jgi:hypothetical protein